MSHKHGRCKSCGGCGKCEPCDHCSNCRRCGKVIRPPVTLVPYPYYVPYYVYPYVPYQPVIITQPTVTVPYMPDYGGSYAGSTFTITDANMSNTFTLNAQNDSAWGPQS